MRFSRDEVAVNEYKESAFEFANARAKSLRSSRERVRNSSIGKTEGIESNRLCMLCMAALTICSIVMIFVAPGLIHFLLYIVLRCGSEYSPTVLDTLARIIFGVTAILFGTMTSKRYLMGGRIGEVNSLVNDLESLSTEVRYLLNGCTMSDETLDSFRKNSVDFSAERCEIVSRINDTVKKADEYARDDYGIVSIVQNTASRIIGLLTMILLFLMFTMLALTNTSVSEPLSYGAIDINTLVLITSIGIGISTIVLAIVEANNSFETEPNVISVIVTVLILIAVNAFTRMTFQAYPVIDFKTALAAISLLSASVVLAVSGVRDQTEENTIKINQFIFFAFLSLMLAPYILILLSGMLNWENDILGCDKQFSLEIMDVIGILLYLALTCLAAVYLHNNVNYQFLDHRLQLGIKVLIMLVAVPITLLVCFILHALMAFILSYFFWIIIPAIIIVVIIVSVRRNRA